MKAILTLVMLVVACAGCRTAHVESAGTHATVVRLNGTARYSNDLLGWSDAKVGAELEPGAVLQTAAAGSAHVELSPVTGGQPHVIYLREKSVLKIERLADTNSATVELRLRSGTLRNYVMPISDDSYFEAGTSNLLVRTRGGIVYLDVSGAVHVSAGTAVVLGAGAAAVRSLGAGQCYNPQTGAVEQWDMSAYAQNDIWPPKQRAPEHSDKTLLQPDEVRERNRTLLWGTPPKRNY